MPEIIEPLTLDLKKFRKRFRERLKYRWARPSVWLVSNEASAQYRELEGEVIIRLYEQARMLFKFRPFLWTDADRLEEVRVLADFAYEQGVNVVGLIKHALVFKDESEARRVLLLSGWRPALARAEVTKVFINRVERSYPQDVLDKKLLTLRKTCPGKSVNKMCAGDVPANHDLCWECHQIYGFTREEYPKWLLFMVRDDRKEYRRRASEILYFEEYSEDVIGKAA